MGDKVGQARAVEDDQELATLLRSPREAVAGMRGGEGSARPPHGEGGVPRRPVSMLSCP